jgi:pyruvate ferredoxin oxidoreductase beta subunit
MATLKELASKQEIFSGGHRACAGCLAAVGLHEILRATNDKVVLGFATGCMEVISTIFPYTAWEVPYLHVAFENCAAAVSGMEAAYTSLKRQGKIDHKINFIGFGGDGGTYDIGLQSLSGAMERGHNMLYVCYNNEAYMNTGVQRSSATPLGAFTSTSPTGKESLGKKRFPKDLTEIMVAHGIPYVAQAAVHHWKDVTAKVEKALSIEGPKFINLLAPCTLGWKFKTEEGLEISRLAADTCVWPLYEVENGKYKVTYKPKEKKSIKEWVESQGRFKHLLKGEKGQELINDYQAEIDRRWDRLLKLSENK